MSAPTTSVARAVRAPGVVISLAMVVVFGVAFVLALDWDRKAAAFPLIASGLGAALGLAGAVQYWPRRSAAPQPGPVEDAENGDDHETAEEISDPLDYVFGTATLRQWLVTLACFGGFFLLLYVAGLYVTSLLFSVVYLKTQDGRSWLFSASYGVVLTGALYLVFELALRQPMPPGLLGLG